MRNKRTLEEIKASNNERQHRYVEHHHAEILKRRAEYRKTPEFKIKSREYRQRPENKERDRQKIARWNKTPKGQATRKRWYFNNRERLLTNAKEYHSRPEIKLKEKRRVLIRKYGQIGLEVLKRDNDKCQKCGGQEQIHLHHIDGDKTNNTPENMIVLCNSCHGKLHLFVPKSLKRLIFEEWFRGENSENKNNSENYPHIRTP